jgi:hypothetical protein
MTPEDMARIRELPKLIAEEKDPAKMKVLAAELERLLSLELDARLLVSEKPKSS